MVYRDRKTGKGRSVRFAARDAQQEKNIALHKRTDWDGLWKKAKSETNFSKQKDVLANDKKFMKLRYNLVFSIYSMYLYFLDKFNGK